jgi:hypothetical protein
VGQREEPVKPQGHVLRVNPEVCRPACQSQSIPGRKDFFAYTYNVASRKKAVCFNVDEIGNFEETQVIQKYTQNCSS